MKQFFPVKHLQFWDIFSWCRYLNFWNQGGQCWSSWVMNLKSGWSCDPQMNKINRLGDDFCCSLTSNFYMGRIHKEQIEKWQEEIKELRLLDASNVQSHALLHDARCLLQNTHIDYWRYHISSVAVLFYLVHLTVFSEDKRM